MNDRESIERALRAEKRFLQRQELLKRLWRLSQSEISGQLLTDVNVQTRTHALTAPLKQPERTTVVLNSTLARM